MYPDSKIYFELASKLKPCTWCRYERKIMYIGRRLKTTRMNNHSFRSTHSIHIWPIVYNFSFLLFFFLCQVISLLCIYYLQFRNKLIVSDITALNTFLNRLRIIVNIPFEEDSPQTWNILVYCSVSHIQKPKSYWLVAFKILKFQLYSHAHQTVSFLHISLLFLVFIHNFMEISRDSMSIIQ